MTMMAGVSTNARPGASAEFAPTIDGQVEADGHAVYSSHSDFVIDDIATANGDICIWLIQTVDNCYIRVGADGAAGASDNWYDDLGAAQGDPGSRTTTGATIFTLGEVPDSVNIYNLADTTFVGAPAYAAYGTAYTSDDKSTFFSPTQDAKYGRMIDSYASAGPGFDSDVEDGHIEVQYTFRKAGASDYTITFSGRARALATSEI